MTIDEAIRDLQARIDGEFSIEGVDDCEDMKLAIEALKFFKECFSSSEFITSTILPSTMLDYQERQWDRGGINHESD